MRHTPRYLMTDPDEVKRLIRANPWTTYVSPASTGLVASHYPTLLEETGEHALGRLNLRVAAATLLCPWLIVHGDADETIPFAEGEQLLAASEQRATLVRVAGGTHTFNVAHGMTVPSPQLREATDATVRFFTERLTPRS